MIRVGTSYPNTSNISHRYPEKQSMLIERFNRLITLEGCFGPISRLMDRWTIDDANEQTNIYVCITVDVSRLIFDTERKRRIVKNKYCILLKRLF